MTSDEFAAGVAAGDFVEHVEYAGNRYGTLRREIERHRDAGRSVIVEIELEGARRLRAMMPEAVTIFIAPPSMEELARRLEARQTDTAAEIAARLEVGEREIAAAAEFDERVVNHDVGAAADELAGVISRRTGLVPVESA
jgi:guanylate kinase